MKSILKVIGGLFLLNIILANLRQEGVISGGITIHYPRLLQKLSENSMLYFVNSDAQMYPTPNTPGLANSLNGPDLLTTLEPASPEVNYDPNAPDLEFPPDSDLAPVPIDFPETPPEYPTSDAYQPTQSPTADPPHQVPATNPYRQLSEIPFTEVPVLSASNLPVYENQEPEEPLADLFEDLASVSSF